MMCTWKSGCRVVIHHSKREESGNKRQPTRPKMATLLWHEAMEQWNREKGREIRRWQLVGLDPYNIEWS